MMLNSMDGCRTNAKSFGERSLGFFSLGRSNLFDFIGLKFSQCKLRHANVGRYSFGKMRRTLLAATPIIGGGFSCFCRLLPLARLCEFCNMFGALLLADNRRPGFFYAFWRLLSACMGFCHLLSGFFVRIKTGRAITAIGHVGKFCAIISIMLYPAPFGFLPVTVAKLYYFDNGAQSSTQKLSNPMRLMTIDFGRRRNMCAYPLFDIIRPSNITNSIIARIFKYINIPGSFVAHICIVPQRLCGYKPEQALCGYDTEHAMPDSWECYRWKAHGGYGSQGNGAGRDNAHRERIWFSPHCIRLNLPRQAELFEALS